MAKSSRVLKRLLSSVLVGYARTISMHEFSAATEIICLLSFITLRGFPVPAMAGVIEESTVRTNAFSCTLLFIANESTVQHVH